MIINASTAKKLSDDANRYDAYNKIADAIKDATERGAYNCQVIIDEQCTKDEKENTVKFQKNQDTVQKQNVILKQMTGDKVTIIYL